MRLPDPWVCCNHAENRHWACSFPSIRSPLAWTTHSVNVTSLIGNCIQRPRIPKKHVPIQTSLLQTQEEPLDPPLFLIYFTVVPLISMKKSVTVPPSVHSARGSGWAWESIDSSPKARRTRTWGKHPVASGPRCYFQPKAHRCGGWNESFSRPPCLDRPVIQCKRLPPPIANTPQDNRTHESSPLQRAAILTPAAC